MANFASKRLAKELNKVSSDALTKEEERILTLLAD
jgi:hypothetical protein